MLTRKMFIFLLPWLGLVIALFGVGVSLLITYHGIHQLDIIEVDPTWTTQPWIKWFLGTGYENYSDVPFQCGLWKTTIGMAYDVYLSYPIVGWFLLLISMFIFTISLVFLLRRRWKHKV